MEAKYEMMHLPPQMEQNQVALQPQLRAIVSGRPMFGQVDILLGDGEKVTADAGSLTWMDGDIPIETGCHGGCWASFCRTCANEHCCFNTYTGPGRVGFSFPLPGDIEAFAVTPEHGWILSQGSFICGTDNVLVSARFTGCLACCTASEGMFVSKVTIMPEEPRKPGMFFAGGFGAIKRHDLEPNKIMYVDNGMFFAAEENTRLQVAVVGGDLKAMCCSGEGFVMRFMGPMVLYTQSRDPNLFRPPPAEGGGAGTDMGGIQ